MHIIHTCFARRRSSEASELRVLAHYKRAAAFRVRASAIAVGSSSCTRSLQTLQRYLLRTYIRDEALKRVVFADHKAAAAATAANSASRHVLKRGVFADHKAAASTWRDCGHVMKGGVFADHKAATAASRHDRHSRYVMKRGVFADHKAAAASAACRLCRRFAARRAVTPVCAKL